MMFRRPTFEAHRREPATRRSIGLAKQQRAGSRPVQRRVGRLAVRSVWQEARSYDVAVLELHFDDRGVIAAVFADDEAEGVLTEWCVQPRGPEPRGEFRSQHLASLRLTHSDTDFPHRSCGALHRRNIDQRECYEKNPNRSRDDYESALPRAQPRNSAYSPSRSRNHKNRGVWGAVPID